MYPSRTAHTARCGFEIGPIRCQIQERFEPRVGDKRLSAESDPASAIYARVETLDVRTLPLSPEEGFVLSRVDGKTALAAIAMVTGVSSERVGTHLRRLEHLGAVRLSRVAEKATTNGAGQRGAGRTPNPRSPTSMAPKATSMAPKATSLAPKAGSIAPRPTLTPKGSFAPPAASVPPAPPLVPPVPPFDEAAARLAHPELDDSLQLSLQLQVRILELAAKLPDLTHFELLGLDSSAERTAIKRAYFSMVGAFHPDTYFGKRMGDFTKRMEKIFQRLTEAHDVLTNRQAREDYETYLAALGRTRRLEAVASAPPPSVEDLERLLLQAEEESRRSPTPQPEAQRPVHRPALQPPPLPQRKPSARPIEMVDDPVARRQALARKFGLVASPSPAPAAVVSETISDRAARRSAAVKDLHQRYTHRKGAIREQRVERFALAAEEALAAGNTVSALNTLKIAQTLSGGDITVMARLGELEKQLGATVADSYLERARYEETNGRLEEAARSYTRAARGRPDADVLRSAAECYLKAGVDLRLAGELAREAVQMAPNRVDLRLTLAKIYEAAGMQQSAVGELERALELTPDSDRIKQWLKRIKRGGV